MEKGGGRAALTPPSDRLLHSRAGERVARSVSELNGA